MASAMYGVSAYQQTQQSWKTTNKKTESTKAPADTKATSEKSAESKAESAKIQTKAWTPIDTKSSLVPQVKEGYGNTIGDVELSDAAKDYYDKLKSKFNNSEFILVSKDMKAQVQQNAAAYGNANKMVVLIDEEKLEKMATDDSYRKKYEGIISMSQTQLANAKNSLASSGASIKNFGMSVDSNGNTNFFATLEDSSKSQQKLLEKKAAAKKEQKAKEKKKAEKAAQEDRLEKARNSKKADKAEKADKNAKTEKAADEEVETEEQAYVMFEADSLDQLIQKVQSYSYDNAALNVRTESEKAVGQHFDFRG